MADNKDSMVVSNTFNKGMLKDYNETFISEGAYTHARNAVNNSHDGQLGVLGNEQGNFKCASLPYTFIGCIHLIDDQWAVFSTNDIDSEIGIFDESLCTYTKVVNDKCLGLKKSNLVTGVYRKKFDCGRLIYWSDGLNPDRYMDLDNVPYIYTQKIVDNCVIKTYTNQLDCEKIRLAPILTHPCLELSKGKGSGTLPNGSYQVCMAYTINEVKVSDYIGLSNMQSIFSHLNLNGSIDVTISSIDKDFDEFELVVISTVNSQVVAKRLGYYSTSVGTIHIDTIDPSLISIPISQISLRIDPLEKSDAIYSVNNYLLKVGSYSKFVFNYQKQANKITTRWTAIQYLSSYYKNGGHNTSYLRDEQYSFFIRWIYNTGERSASFHIPGRAPLSYDTELFSTDDAYENSSGILTYRWQVENTATVDSTVSYDLPDGGKVIASGKMGYWESTEKYPADRYDIWGELCGKPIRHHKMPDETVDPIVNHFNMDGENIVLLGVEFENITHPVDNNGNKIESIVGYEILRGSREGQKSIIAKGMFNNMREYNLIGTSGVKGLYQNYPYNDLRDDYLLTSDANIIDKDLAKIVSTDINSTQSNFEFDEENEDKNGARDAGRKAKNQRSILKEYGKVDPGDVNLGSPLSEYKSNYLSFHSPETTFSNPFLAFNEIKIYQEYSGTSYGSFNHPYKHPKFKTPTNFAAIFSSVIGTISIIGNAISGFSKDPNMTLPGTDKFSYSKKLTLAKNSSFSVGAATVMAGNPLVAIQNLAVGLYNTAMAIAMSFIDAQAVGEQIMNVVYGMIPKRQNALQYDSHGFYNQSRINPEGNRRRKVTNSMYVGPNVHSFDTRYTINNLYRPNFVAVKISNSIQDPYTEDKSRFRINDPSNNYANGLTRQVIPSQISGYYGSLKVSYPSQYGQLESIKQIPISGCIHPADYKSTKTYSTGLIYGGDTYINRFTEKNTFTFFNDWLMGEPDETEIDYRDFMNVAFPRFWIDNNRHSFKLFQNASNHRHLDERESSMFFVSKGYFYLFFNGVRDFFVESEINLAQRDWEDDLPKRHYDPYRFTQYNELFRSDIIKSGNYYKYDYSLSISKAYNNYVSWGSILPRDYDPTIAEKCYVYKPNRISYSLPQEDELKKDNWRMFLPNNYKEFSSPVTSIKAINKTGALFMMRYQGPLQFTGVDSLQSDIGTKITLGDGGLFQQPLQSVTNADEAYEYGSNQNKFSTISTVHGVFWVSQDQGKVFHFAGQLDEISRYGMKWWFAKYLPSRLAMVYPNYPHLDNPIKGVGVQMIYDNTNEIVYISKKDYKPKRSDLLYDSNGDFYYEKEQISIEVPQKTTYTCPTGYVLIDNQCVKVSNPQVIIDPVTIVTPAKTIKHKEKVYCKFTDEQYWEDASWTISYDPKQKAWISFHDWKPDFLVPGKAHFMSVKDNAIWSHNIRCDKYTNFYGIDYPFEIEFVSSTGQQVVSMKNIEYLLEVFNYSGNCHDRFHYLDENFDEAIVYNSEQISGLLKLDIKSKINPLNLLQYPIINESSINIQYSKEEQKYRFNQFWDITKDRGEFSKVATPLFVTDSSGYKFNINPLAVNYEKLSLQHKRFRHNVNRVFLRKTVSDNKKMIFKMSNTKIQASSR